LCLLLVSRSAGDRNPGGPERSWHNGQEKCVLSFGSPHIGSNRINHRNRSLIRRIMREN